jgi:uncharacterized protein (TIGR00290 family)
LKEKVILNWSGGRDSALCLYRMLRSEQYDIRYLLTTLSDEYQRISMHGVRMELLEAQAESTGLPLKKVFLPEMPDMETYENKMLEIMNGLKSEGITASVFGDIFLDDLRRYREDSLAKSGIRADFPLWKIPTNELIREFIGLGFKTIVTCVSEKHLDRSFAGRIIDEDFLDDLPENVDPCGENGEFHTFVFDGPVFRKPINYEKGEIVYRKYGPEVKSDSGEVSAEKNHNDPYAFGYWYCDLLPRE